jgi:flagellar biosynthesis protein FliR
MLFSANTMATPEQKKNNRRLGLILASVALLFFLGFMARMILIGF